MTYLARFLGMANAVGSDPRAPIPLKASYSAQPAEIAGSSAGTLF